MNDKLRNLSVRTATSAVFVAVVLAGMLGGRLAFAALLMCITAGCMWEFYGLAGKSGAAPHKMAGTLIGMLIVGINLGIIETVINDISFLKYTGAAFVLAIVLSVALFIGEIWRQKGNPMQNLGATFLGVAYIALPVSLIALFPIVGNKMLLPWNPLIAVAFILIVWAGDTFAYLTGIAFGKHPFFERLSPKKSWEGFVGGLVGATAAGAIVGKFLVKDDMVLWMGLGLLVGLTAVLGDLVESNFKRSVGAKDSGKALPGHGGLLDRFDAMLVAAPFVFILFLIMQIMTSHNLFQTLLKLL